MTCLFWYTVVVAQATNTHLKPIVILLPQGGIASQRLREEKTL
ncbi:hypothetical protein ACVRWQ_05175 [Streptococcus phocae subsp. salmonis]